MFISWRSDRSEGCTWSEIICLNLLPTCWPYPVVSRVSGGGFSDPPPPMNRHSKQQTLKTRMHSSRKHTVRCSGRLGGVCLGGVCLGGLPRGMSAWGVSAGGRGLYPGGVSQTPLWTELQTGVKTLLCRNYVADGKSVHIRFRLRFVWTMA